MKRTPIRSVSDRRRKRDAGYAKARKAVAERADGLCEAGATWKCAGRGAEAHHVAGRLGPDPHRLDNLIWVCAPCHAVIHHSPSQSYANGWMVRRNGAPDA